MADNGGPAVSVADVMVRDCARVFRKTGSSSNKVKGARETCLQNSRHAVGHTDKLQLRPAVVCIAGQFATSLKGLDMSAWILFVQSLRKRPSQEMAASH